MGDLQEGSGIFGCKGSIEDDGKMRTELYVKPTAWTGYLHKESDHSQYVKQGIAKGQVKRLKRLNTREEDYDKYCKVLKTKLMARGYGKTGIEKEIRQGRR
jgi:hypothetical protein